MDRSKLTKSNMFSVEGYQYILCSVPEPEASKLTYIFSYFYDTSALIEVLRISVAKEKHVLQKFKGTPIQWEINHLPAERSEDEIEEG